MLYLVIMIHLWNQIWPDHSEIGNWAKVSIIFLPFTFWCPSAEFGALCPETSSCGDPPPQSPWYSSKCASLRVSPPGGDIQSLLLLSEWCRTGYLNTCHFIIFTCKTNRKGYLRQRIKCKVDVDLSLNRNYTEVDDEGAAPCRGGGGSAMAMPWVLRFQVSPTDLCSDVIFSVNLIRPTFKNYSPLPATTLCPFLLCICPWDLSPSVFTIHLISYLFSLTGMRTLWRNGFLLLLFTALSLILKKSDHQCLTIFYWMRASRLLGKSADVVKLIWFMGLLCTYPRRYVSIYRSAPETKP